MIYRMIVILTLTLFYGCYFIKAFCQKKNGIQTTQLGKGKHGFVKFIEIAMAVFSILIVVAEVVSVYAGTYYNFALIRITGAALSIVGVTVFIVSVLTMRDSWRVGVPEHDKVELVTTGIYQISRNPAFLGFDLVYIGILMMFFNGWLCLVTLVTVILFHLQIVNVEEDYLLVTFGEEYLKYKRKVCRYLGRKH